MNSTHEKNEEKPQPGAKMRALKSRTVRVADLEVKIEPTLMRIDEGLVLIHVHGICGKSTYARKITLHPDPCATREKIDRVLLQFFDKIARQAAGREKIRRLAEALS